MIINKQPLTINEVIEYVRDSEEKEELVKYLKKFGKLSREKSKKTREAIAALKNPKIKEEHIVKAVDFMPNNNEEINKIFLDANLNEEEANSILEIIKTA